MFGFIDSNFIFEFVCILCFCFILAIFRSWAMLAVFRTEYVCSVTHTWNLFLINKIAGRFTCVAFVETSYSSTDTCWFESSPSEESRASDVASPMLCNNAMFLTARLALWLVGMRCQAVI